ncbi:hypothetical protein PVAND_013470 [Polypedilum vanderplanki]|uniref:Uncharacterized protein n=1 Tax=Polypedilum vanderplanki TaxID=319348 RepID=A0A9J6CQK5_POLVA|nr:hypothetical protein PVAND_013470 [Polypedilum vanderplanki]
MYLIRILISFLLFSMLTAIETIISSPVVITCEAPILETCVVIANDRINSIDDRIQIIGADMNVERFFSVTGFYALSKNINMKFIPSNIFMQMPNLAYFFAHDVQLEELPTNTFRECSKLLQISLQENKLRNLGEGFAEGCSKTLYLLDLSYNQLSALNANSFKGLTSLTVLNMNFNFIEVIEKGTFDNMPALSLITLDMNKISFIHPATFTSLTSLNSLVLTNNKIKVIKSGWFANKTYFERVNLKNNEIVAVDSKIFDTWMITNSNETQLKISYNLNLEGNDCIDMELKKISEKTIPYFKNSLNRCFVEYEENYYYKNFP